MSRFLFPLALIFVGCNTQKVAQEEQSKADLAIIQVRAEVDDIKHDLNSYEIEHHILEGKVTDLESTLQVHGEALKLEELHGELDRLDKQIKLLGKKQNEIIADIRQLSQHANETTIALSQYKEKLVLLNKTETYVIKAGDTLEKIARKYETTVEAIKSTNNLKDDLILVGDEIVIPKS
ncbi:MAG: LysM peptidoglycan-binding domain-containing protein [Simkaniaceae bacterium]|nr:LysM peptidoglycan-binding domain-containing protein [Simkaniaceae bacterium]